MSEEATLDEFVENDSGVKGKFVETAAGQLPVDWDTKNVEELCALRNGKAANHTAIGEQEFLVYGSNGPIGSHSESNFDGGLIFGRVGAVGEVERVKEPVWVSDNAIQASVTNKCNTDFLYYYLSNEELSSLATKTAQPLLNQSTIGNVAVPSPPLPEQQKIATVLYTVDRAIEKTSELIEQLERVKQGVRQNILTSGITEDGKVRASPKSEPEQYTDARQWTVPNSWELKELSDVCSSQVGYAFKSDWYRDEGNVRVLRGANVGYGEPDWSETYYLEPDRVSEYGEYRLEEGDLIIGMDRPYTKSGFKISRLSEDDVPSLLVQRVGRFVPEACDPDYLHVVLSDWRYQKQVLRRAQGMDIPHISQTDILSPKIPLPPLGEQKRIADRYSSILERIDCEENLLGEYKTLKQGLMQDLLSGTVRTTDTTIEVPDEIAQHG